jgi:hypothetical protein
LRYPGTPLGKGLVDVCAVTVVASTSTNAVLRIENFMAFLKSVRKWCGMFKMNVPS